MDNKVINDIYEVLDNLVPVDALVNTPDAPSSDKNRIKNGLASFLLLQKLYDSPEYFDCIYEYMPTWIAAYYRLRKRRSFSSRLRQMLRWLHWYTRPPAPIHAFDALPWGDIGFLIGGIAVIVFFALGSVFSLILAFYLAWAFWQWRIRRSMRREVSQQEAFHAGILREYIFELQSEDSN